MSRADELRAELKVAELEEKLAALKGSGDEAKLRKAKYALRDARQQFRQLRAGMPPDVGEGDAVVRPDTIEAKATVEETG
jgi:hypothetical protein